MKKAEIPNKRMPAEWENPKAILLSLPSASSDWNYILEEALLQYARLIEAFVEGGENLVIISEPDSLEHIKKLATLQSAQVITDIPYNDTWTRDYGSITIIDDGEIKELDFGFNGWGLKFAADNDNLVNLRLAEKGYSKKSRYENHRDFTLEGGSIESDGKGTLLTTSRCLCSPNRNGGKDKQEIEEILKVRLGARRVLWLDHGFLAGDDTDSHIDTLARLAPDNTIIYVAPPKDEDDEHYEELKKMEEQLSSFLTSDGKPYRLVPLPFPDPIFDEEGQRLPATYANYLVTGKNVFVPVYGQKDKDELACARIKEVFPHHRLFAVDCTTLIKQHGSLHCSTMQLY